VEGAGLGGALGADCSHDLTRSRYRTFEVFFESVFSHTCILFLTREACERESVLAMRRDFCVAR